jgi:NAD(P)-dependent dehydrogenase (short-subunit alcohol dehydrogenase family)
MNIVITGASSGIGKAVANHLAKVGHQVLGTSRYKEGRFDNFELLKLDVTDNSSVEKFIEQIFHRFQQVDVLINNAGYVISGPVENITIEEAKQQIDTNYFGVVRLTQKFLPHFRANNKGKIINICSLAGQIGMPFQAHYSASKYALEGFTDALRLELSPFKIQVCNINPGDFRTNITYNRKITPHIDSAYKMQFERILDIYATEENNGADPVRIANLITSLLSKNKLKARYTVGKFSQTSSVTFKRIFGTQLFERVMKIMWKIK